MLIMAAAPPFNLHRWIDQNRDLLKPPVGNKLLFDDSGFIIMAVGGPNSRKDFHHDPFEEFFFQIEGDMILRTVQDGRLTDVPIRAGEMYLLPTGGFSRSRLRSIHWCKLKGAMVLMGTLYRR